MIRSTVHVIKNVCQHMDLPLLGASIATYSPNTWWGCLGQAKRTDASLWTDSKGGPGVGCGGEEAGPGQCNSIQLLTVLGSWVTLERLCVQGVLDNLRPQR